MKFDINNNPALMQAAGNTPKAQYFAKVMLAGPPRSEYELISIQANGKVIIKSIFNGELYIQEFENNPSDWVSVVPYDPNTMITIIGDLTIFSSENIPDDITYLDLNKCTNLTRIVIATTTLEDFSAKSFPNLTFFSCRSNSYKRLIFPNNPLVDSVYIGGATGGTTPIEEIDVLSCSSITILSVPGPSPKIKNIRCCANRSVISSSVQSLINNSEVSNGVLTLRNGDEYNSQVAQAATAKGWTVEYVDA